MILSEIFEYLTYGEMYNMYIATNDEGVLRKKDYPRIISIINMGMMDLHKRFPILYKQVNVQMYEHISDYVLEKYYAQSNTTSGASYKYIIDSPNKPFNNDLIRIMSVMTEDCCEIPLNVPNNQFSVFTPSYNIVQIQYPIKENILGIEYQAYPEKIPLDTTDIENYYVEFPEYLLEALSNYVNWKLYSATGMEKPESAQYIQKYELECSRIHNFGLYNMDQSRNLKLENNGWV